METITEYGDIAVEQSGGGQGLITVRDIAARETLSMFYDLTDALGCMAAVVRDRYGHSGMDEWLHQLHAAPGAFEHWEWQHSDDDGMPFFCWAEGY